jgi:hypothetical protein
MKALTEIKAALDTLAGDIAENIGANLTPYLNGAQQAVNNARLNLQAQIDMDTEAAAKAAKAAQDALDLKAASMASLQKNIALFTEKLAGLQKNTAPDTEITPVQQALTDAETELKALQNS